MEEDIELLKTYVKSLFDYCLRTDARLMGMQTALSRVIMKNEEMKEAFENEMKENYKIVYNAAQEQMKKNFPDMYLRVYGD